MTDTKGPKAKVNLNHALVREDETPWTKEFKPQNGVQIFQWKPRWDGSGRDYQLLPGIPDDPVILLDVLRTVYSQPVQGEERKDKSKKNELLKRLNRFYKGQSKVTDKPMFVLDPLDAEWTLEQAAKTVEPLAYGQLEDLIKGDTPLGYYDEEETDEEDSGAAGGAGGSGGGGGAPEDDAE